MRLISINDKGGNQDRSLSANAVYLFNLLRVIKDADPDDTGTTFDFTAAGDPGWRQQRRLSWWSAAASHGAP